MKEKINLSIIRDEYRKQRKQKIHQMIISSHTGRFVKFKLQYFVEHHL